MLKYYLFPLFTTTILSRFKAQFTPLEEGWLYTPEARVETSTISHVTHKEYTTTFKTVLILNAIQAAVSAVAILCCLLYSTISIGYYTIGLLLGSVVYYDAYTKMIVQYYNPENRKRTKSLLIGVGVFALLALCNYQGWYLSREYVGDKIGVLIDAIGLTPILYAYPRISFGVFILTAIILRGMFGVHSAWFSPLSKKRKQEIIDQRNNPKREKYWDKAMREAQEKEKLSKKEKKRRKKEMKKQGKVFPKKYKGDTQ